MLTGYNNVKYGLAVPKKEAKTAPKKALAVFGDDSDEDDGNKVARDIERQAQRKQCDKKVAAMQAAALAEDPSIFDYDAHYDSMEQQRQGPTAAAKQARKSRYIEGLLDKAKEREKEQDIIYERKLLRERKAEDHLFGDKERFVTAAYKQKLEEDKKWLEEEALRDKVEAEQDVRKRGHMGDFYRNLLSNNVAFGTADPKKGKPSPDDRTESISEPASSAAAAKDEPSSIEPKDPKWEQMRRAREAYEEKLAEQNAAQGAAESSSPGRPMQAQDEGADRDNSGTVSGKNVPGAAGNERSSDEGGDAGAAKTDEPAPAVLSKEEKAALARERFLARKRKTPG